MLLKAATLKLYSKDLYIVYEQLNNPECVEKDRFNWTGLSFIALCRRLD